MFSFVLEVRHGFVLFKQSPSAILWADHILDVAVCLSISGLAGLFIILFINLKLTELAYHALVLH